MVTSRKDLQPWWEAMIECVSNTYQSSLRELHFIDRPRRLSLNPLTALCCLCTNKWAKHTSQACTSGNFHWFDLCSLFLLLWKKGTAGKLLRPVQQVLCVVVSAQVCWRTWFITMLRIWQRIWQRTGGLFSVMLWGVLLSISFSSVNLKWLKLEENSESSLRNCNQQIF